MKMENLMKLNFPMRVESRKPSRAKSDVNVFNQSGEMCKKLSVF